MSDKSADAVALKNLWMFCKLFLVFSNTFVDREWITKLEFLRGTMHMSQAQIKCNTFPAVLLCTYSVLDKFKVTGLIKGSRKRVRLYSAVGKNVHATILIGNMEYDRYTVPDDCSCRTYFCCFPLALANRFSWSFVPILSNFFEEQ